MAYVAPTYRTTGSLITAAIWNQDVVDNMSAVYAALAQAVPTGFIAPMALSAAPSGWLLCDGAAVSRATYAALFAAIGTTFGVGDGSTTFNVPDLRQRFPLGKAASGTGNTLGAAGGAIDHAHSVSGTTDAAYGSTQTDIPSGDRSYIGNHAHTFSATSGTNNPPFLVLNFAIKA